VATVKWERLFDREILIVSGKGGTGKSTVAAALATRAARSGRRVLLAEVEGRGEICRTLGITDPGFQERPAPSGFNVLSITPQAAAFEYLHVFFGMDRVSRSIMRAGVLDQVIGGAPGFRDLLICGKLYEITRVRRTNPRDRGRPEYDLVVVDAPPTGQIVSFLSAPAAFAELIRVGRMRRQAVAIRRMLRDHAHLALITTLEEMPVAETLEAVPALSKTGVPVAAIVANRRLDPILPRGSRRTVASLSASEVAAISGRAGLALKDDDAAIILEGALSRDSRHRLQGTFLSGLRKARSPVLSLPDVHGVQPPDLVDALAGIMAGLDPPSPSHASSKPHSRRGALAREGGLDRCLEGARIVVVCGSGGVGKTTISTAVALNRAERGARTMLLTVDPARRLATALRLPTSAGERTEVRVAGGRTMEALQLDTQRTFDELVERHAGSDDRRDRILANPYYRRISGTLAGTNEYMAMEKLYELAAEGEYEAIVVDTPPTRSALSFLEAPNRLTDFLGGRFFRWMLWPGARAGSLGLRVTTFGAATFARTAGRLVGAQTLADTAEFLAAFDGMYAGFKERAGRVLALLGSGDCTFVVVTVPSNASLEEAGYFVDRLSQHRMRLAAVVANRWLREPPLADGAGASAAVSSLAGGETRERAVAAILRDRLEREGQRAAEEAAMSSFIGRQGAVPLVAVPELPGDIHDVRGLRRVAERLFR